MRKYVMLSIFIFLVSNLYSERAYLLPSRKGEQSEIIPVRNIPHNKINTDAKENIKGYLSWIEYGWDGNYYLSRIEDVDTFLVWFEPSVKCSVLAYQVINIAAEDTNQNQFTIFFALLDQSIDFINDFDEYHSSGDIPGPPPIDSIIQIKDTFCYGGDSMFTIITDTLISPIDNGLDIFGAGWIKARGDSSPNPRIYANSQPPYHTLMHREGEDIFGWYSSWGEIGIRALVSYYENLPPEISIEDLPDTYTQGIRKVNIYAKDAFGIPTDSSGIDYVIIQYQVNSGIVNEIQCVLYSGDSIDGYWKGNIPGTPPGDTVTYWGIATDFQGVADTSGVKLYIIRQGESGDFLYVDNDIHIYDPIVSNYINYIDYWDYDVYGSPDSSVIASYEKVTWRDNGCIALGPGVDYGIGINYSDSTWIKMLLDRGGRFWLSDQDQGYGLGICPDYGQHDVSANHWVQQYLGIQGMYDDNPLLIGGSVVAYGSAVDPLVGIMFQGVGSQNVGQLYIAPYYSVFGSWGYSYIGSFDSLQSGAVNSIFDINGLTISYYYEGPGGSDYKVVNDFWPWDYICVPGDSMIIDSVAVEALFDTILVWLYSDAIPEDRNLYPENIVKLLPTGIVYDNTIFKFYVPREMPISLSIYDKTGRLIKNLKNGKAKAGFNLIKWNGKDSYGNSVSSGIYFYQLISRDKTLINKMVILK